MREPQWLRQLLVGSYLRNTREAAARPRPAGQSGDSSKGAVSRGSEDVERQGDKHQGDKTSGANNTPRRY